MANIQSQKKRNRQNERRRINNSQVRSSIRTASKRVVRTIESKESVDPAALQELYRQFVKRIDKAAQKGVVHRNTAARRKSRLYKKVNAAIQKTS